MMPKRRSRALRTIGWLAVTSMLATAILGPGAGAALANDLNQDPPISWDANGSPQGSDMLLQWVTGKLQPVFPPAVALAQPIQPKPNWGSG